MPAAGLRLLKWSARWIAVAGATLFASAADPVAVWIAFTEVHSSHSPSGTVKYVDLLVGSNETATPPRVFSVSVELVTSDAKRRVICRASEALTTALRPHAVRPLRVQIVQKKEGEPEKHTVAATAAWMVGGNAPSEGTAENETTLEVARGATVQCMRRR